MDDTSAVDLSFNERLGIIVDREIVVRGNRRLARQIREARPRFNACIEHIHCIDARGLDRSVTAGLRTCRWIEERLSVVTIGPTGVGKSSIACALGTLACHAETDTRLGAAD